ncbi:MULTISPECIES: precorrin-6y C5,15-methyltransferase (decarboxylating) subunit CbiE [unclassified Clostridium]|uniref:precorrin-6y C5,15-methyltransferase (decarboxylating) subunit CbiE n=1 Tax=unclassified Clostridium TaxID=2614128 RepID=UPI0002984478|nr:MULTISPECIES: precorrin-6y C5,15-methyltransferase (decarboxylating) subunit CbiE [unclassified Clostridium]EKQ57594.1 MAG: precorrin-6y C5,15-methyltransferase (decarboxylating), CbiE subunit [Clostridium sp. Maddingley MBC34-26]
MIYIVGLGPGHRDYIMPKAVEMLRKSDIVLGFKRALDSLDFVDNKKMYINKLSDIDEFLNDEKNKDINVSVVASGDPTFYGITNYINNKTNLNIKVIPGISSFQYLTCKLNLSWSNAYLSSLHGRKEEFLDAINIHKLSIWLTDKENNPAILCKILHENNINCKVIVGENLSYEDEIITEGSPIEFLNQNFSPLSVFIVEKII